MSDPSLNPRIQVVLNRLDRVKRAGKGFIARCPAHDDRSASLSICEGRNGRVLLNCFAGCGALGVLSSIGLTMEDLHKNRSFKDMTDEERAEAHEQFARVKWAAALDNLVHESWIIVAAAQAMADGKVLDADTKRRLYKAVKLVSDAKVVLSTGPARRRIQLPPPPDKLLSGESK